MFFDDDANFSRLLAEVQTWKGTPFGRGGCQKGVVTDCVRWVNQALVNIGAITSAQFPKSYVIRGGGRPMLDIFEAAVATVPQFDRVWRFGEAAVEPVRGDILLLSTGEALHHLAIVAQPPTVWHCLKKVEEANIHDPSIRKHFWAIYRIK